MKKSLIVIALALLMIVPVFAASETRTENAKVVYAENANDTPLTTTGDTEKTDVKVTLNLYPKYVFGISNEKYVSANITIDSTETSKTYYEKLPAVTEINMTNDETKLEVGSPSDTYYISYWFRDYNQDCTLSCAIDQDLWLQEDDGNYTAVEGDEDSNYKIKYKATITPEGAVENEKSAYAIDAANTIYSPGNSGSSTSVAVVKCAATKLLGQVVCGNLKIVLAPVDGDKSTANKYVGSYLSHLVLTLKSNA